VNSRLKRRLIVVTGVIVVVTVTVLAVVASATASKTVTVAEAASGSYDGMKIQVSGKVIDDSYSIEGSVLRFSLYDDAQGTAGVQDAQAAEGLEVVYDKGISATFGNQVTAICTGTIGSDGVLVATELVTKCPSKYENSTNALDVTQLRSYGEDIVGKPVKLAGVIREGTLKPVGQQDRFVLMGQEEGDDLSILFEGALPDGVREGGEVVLTGSLDAVGRFRATDVALKG
jgi:cytochrome c-type biogenesis protein CcmE